MILAIDHLNHVHNYLSHSSAGTGLGIVFVVGLLFLIVTSRGSW